MIPLEQPWDDPLPLAPASQIGLDLVRQPAVPELAAARVELARRAPATTFDPGIAASGASGEPAAAAVAPENFKRFEAMVLQTFIQNMLPKDGAAVYGKGMAGDMWKAMLAEKMADAMAERGGIGIADRLLEGRYAGTAGQAVPAGGVAGSAALEAGNRAASIAPAVLEDMQRSLSTLLADEPASADVTVRSITKRG